MTRDVLYADDTLLMSSHMANLQKLLEAIVSEGALYGLELNWQKTQQVQISTVDRVVRPDGGEIKSVREAVYLGALVSCDGKGGRELSRRLAEAHRTFEGLQAAWVNTGLGRRRKLEIYMAYVVSKLMCSLETIWLLKHERAKLDAFHHRCLRKILGIPHSYISRVSNADVLDTSGLLLLSDLLATRQAALYKKISDQPPNSIARQLVCSESGEPRLWSNRRSRGWPRQMWAAMVYRLGIE